MVRTVSPRRRDWLARALTLSAGAGLSLSAFRQTAAASPSPGDETGADLLLSGADGQPLQLSRLPASAIWLDFWASWCAPCRLSFPWMADLHQRMAARGLAVVAVNLDARAADAQAFLRARPVPFQIAFDAAGDSARRYRVAAMPTSLLLEGGTLRVRLRHAGFRTADVPALEAAIGAALAR